MDTNQPKHAAERSLNVLFFMHHGVNTGDILKDVVEGFREAGHCTFLFDLGVYGHHWDNAPDETTKFHIAETHAEILQAFAVANAIDLAVCMWGNGPGMIEAHLDRNFFDALGLPLLMYWLDAPQWAHSGSVLTTPQWLWNSPMKHHWVNNFATAQELVALMGFQNVHIVSHGGNPRRFKPAPATKKEFDIVFGVGADHVQPSDVMLEELGSDEPDVARITLDQASRILPELCNIAAPLCVAGPVEPFVAAVVDEHIADCHRPVLEQLQCIAHKHPQWSSTVLALLKDAKTCITFAMKLRSMHEWERAFAFCWLSRYFRCATFGLSEVFPDWPGDWEYLGKLDYDDQSRAYSRAHFGLNVMRWQDDLGLNIKPYEITLSGACLLQSHRRGVDELFAPDSIVTFNTPVEARSMITPLLSEPSRIEEMANAARAHSLNHHTWQHRVEQIIASMRGESPSLETQQNRASLLTTERKK